jgi:four helix bundle protein
MEGGYKKLEIYNLAHSLALKVHKMTMSLPKFEMYEEGGQIRRSSKSVSAQIVEGYALRKYKNEFLHYLWRAYGSSEETLEHLSFLFETESLKDEKLFQELSENYKQLNRMLFNYIQSVERTFETPAFLKEPSTEYQADSTVKVDQSGEPEPPNLESLYPNEEP